MFTFECFFLFFRSLRIIHTLAAFYWVSVCWKVGTVIEISFEDRFEGNRQIFPRVLVANNALDLDVIVLADGNLFSLGIFT